MFFASLPHWVAVMGVQRSAQDLMDSHRREDAGGPMGHSLLPELPDVNFTVHPNRGKSQSNLVKAIGLVITKKSRSTHV